MTKAIIQYRSQELEISIVSVPSRCVQFIVDDDLSIVMRAPVGMSRVMVEDYIELHKNTIIRAYEEKKLHNHQTLPIVLDVEEGQIQYHNGLRLPFLGDMDLFLKIKYTAGMNGAKCYVERRSDGGRNLVIKTDREDQEFIRRCVIRFYSRWSQKIAMNKASEYAKLLQLEYRKLAITEELLEEQTGFLRLTAKNLSVKNQPTIWGQCNWKKELKFDWKLSMLPLEVIEYVIVHELSHLKNLNHSSSFWKAVENVMPEYSECRNWLEKHGQEYEIF